ncbi:MAG TPA: GntR family transcriptional regulator [Nocardioidaceae bacterium]|nr:GntR family transcriptional regulator [Nocardioidaceae bacterium]
MPTGPDPLDRDSTAPLWRQLHDDVLRRLEGGEFSASFPGEHTLRGQYGVSRQTVRTALRSLRESGAIIAGRGMTPRVGTGRIEQSLGTLYSLFTSVERAGMTQHSSVLALDRRTDEAVAHELGLSSDAELIHLSRIRYADESPIAFDQSWLPASLAAPLLDADFTRTALYDELESRCGVRPGGGSEIIDAVNLTPDEARRLGCAPGAAAFSIQRTGCLRGRPIEWRHSLVRADRFRVNTRFSPASGYRLSVDPYGAETTEPTDTRNA